TQDRSGEAVAPDTRRAGRVVMRCLEKDRSRRYDTASNLARDVERFLKDEPVEARPPSAWYRLRKAARRDRAAPTGGRGVAAAPVVGTAATLWQVSVARTERAARLAADRQHHNELDAIGKQQAEALLAERRQYALERATEAAFSGDLAKARKAIAADEQ